MRIAWFHAVVYDLKKNSHAFCVENLFIKVLIPQKQGISSVLMRV